MLPLLGALLFALVGIGALVIDGGLALTEQARLETAAEMMVSEWAYVTALPNDALPSTCVVGGARRETCLERAYLEPILSPLGVDVQEGAGDDVDLQRRDASLDGTAIDPRGARVGELDVQGAFDAGTPADIQLTRSSPLLFGWAAIPARTRTGSGEDFGAVQAARAAQGLAPDAAGTGLRTEGFSLAAGARIDPAGAAAMRVGPPIDDPADGSPLTGGLVGVAWLAGDLIDRESFGLSPRLVEALATTDPSAPGAAFQSVAGRLESATGDEVACLFDASTGGAHVGQEIGGPTLPFASAVPARRWTSAYVPVIETCDAPSRILGFLEIEIDALTDPAAVRVRQSASLRRNAAGVPSGAAEAADAARVWNAGTRVGQLIATNTWSANGLRVARLETSP